MPIKVPLFAAIGLTFAANAQGQSLPVRQEADLIAAKHKQMTGPEVASLLTGNTAYFLFLASFGNVPAGTVAAAYFRDPKVRIRLMPDGKKYPGNWRIDGNLVCAEAGSREICYSYYQVEGATYLCRQPERICDLTVRVVPGNVEKM